MAEIEKDIYAVRRKFKDEKHQLGLFHELANAKKLAKKNYGFKVWNIETKELVFEPKLTPAQEFIGALREMDQIMQEDIAEGHQWVYSNNAKKIPKGKNFDDTRKKGYYAVNCVDGVQWGMKKVGANATAWYGQQGGNIRWLNDHAKADAEKYFDLIEIGGRKTVRQLVDEGFLKPGDILTYYTMSHTNAYLGNRKSFDSGHAHCTRGGEGAPFTKWIGSLTCGGHRVGWIMRWKEWKRVLRVQVGAFETNKALCEISEMVTAETGFKCFSEKKDGLTYLFCGSFETKEKAEERLAIVQGVIPKAFLKECDVLV